MNNIRIADWPYTHSTVLLFQRRLEMRVLQMRHRSVPLVLYWILRWSWGTLAIWLKWIIYQSALIVHTWLFNFHYRVYSSFKNENKLTVDGWNRPVDKFNGVLLLRDLSQALNFMYRLVSSPTVNFSFFNWRLNILFTMDGYTHSLMTNDTHVISFNLLVYFILRLADWFYCSTWSRVPVFFEFRVPCELYIYIYICA
jgi:hypothetical protein